MAATGNEVVLLRQLKAYGDTKLNAPASAGTDGQILAWQMPGSVNNETIWVDPVDAIPSASQSSSGLMSSADKKKLDGLNIKMATDKDAKAFLGY